MHSNRILCPYVRPRWSHSCSQQGVSVHVISLCDIPCILDPHCHDGPVANAPQTVRVGIALYAQPVLECTGSCEENPPCYLRVRVDRWTTQCLVSNGVFTRSQSKISQMSLLSLNSFVLGMDHGLINPFPPTFEDDAASVDGAIQLAVLVYAYVGTS